MADQHEHSFEEVIPRLDAEHAKDGSVTPWLYYKCMGRQHGGTFKYDGEKWVPVELQDLHSDRPEVSRLREFKY